MFLIVIIVYWAPQNLLYTLRPLYYCLRVGRCPERTSDTWSNVGVVVDLQIPKKTWKASVVICVERPSFAWRHGQTVSLRDSLKARVRNLLMHANDVYSFAREDVSFFPRSLVS